MKYSSEHVYANFIYSCMLPRSHRLHNKKAKLSLTNPRDAKACQKLLQ